MRLILAIFIVHGLLASCSEFLSIEKRELRESNVAEIRKDVSCAGPKIHNGDLLNNEEKEKYRNVGFVLVFGPPDVDGNAQLASICSGYLIKPNVVLTAQHCIADNNQTPFNKRQVFFSFDNDDKIWADNAAGKPLNMKRTERIIQWAERGENYRDVALIELASSFDEEYVPFDLMQTELTEENATIVMAGYGNYVEGQDRDTFDQGVRRIGRAKFNGYTQIEEFPDFDNPDFIGSADYLSAVPDFEFDFQMICQGDSGSAAFYDNGYATKIIGVTSMQDTRGSTQELACINSREGLFVPAHQIRPWVSRELAKIDSSYALKTYSTARIEVETVTSNDNDSELSLRVVEMYDNGLALPTDRFKAKLCTASSCAVTPQLSLELKKSSIANVEIIQESGTNYISIAKTTDQPNKYNTEIQATIVSVGENKSEDGRSQRTYRMKYNDAVGSNRSIPSKYDQEMDIIYCSSGCSQNSRVKTKGFNLTADKGVKARVSVIGDKVYFREVESNPSYDSEHVEKTRAGIPFRPASATCIPPS